MHIISRKALRDFWEKHPDSQAPLTRWFRVVKAGQFGSFPELRAVFPSADKVGKWVIFNIGGNKYRLITQIYYEDQTVLIRFVLTHADYNREKWKNDCNR